MTANLNTFKQTIDSYYQVEMSLPIEPNNEKDEMDKTLDQQNSSLESELLNECY